MARNAGQDNQDEKDVERPWWHEDASEFAGDEPEPQPSNAEETSELLNTATQEAVQLAATLSTWAEKTGFAPILRSVAQQAMDTAQDAAGSLKSSGNSGKTSASAEDEEAEFDDLEALDDELEAELEAVDLESDDFSHLDDDPAAAGVVQFHSADGTRVGEHHLHQSSATGEVRITCDYCPVCRVIESLDDLNPETAAAIAEVMAVVTDGVATAVMELVSKGSDEDN